MIRAARRCSGDDSPNAGFSVHPPWLPIGPDYRADNVRCESADPASLLTLYRTLLRLRRHESALATGAYVPVATSGDLLAYVRAADGEQRLVALNLGPNPLTFDSAQPSLSGQIMLSTCLDRGGERVHSRLTLRPHEGVVVALDPDAAAHVGVNAYGVAAQ